ncbi:MAG: type II toxin-antitoxin system MqsR family toxin [Campylobacterales bacterium]
MEKKVAHYSLDSIKTLIKDEKYFITKSARMDYIKLGLNDDEVLKIINTLKNRNLYKSMTSYSNTQIWQDVYHTSYKEIELYIKLQISEDAIVISFKERT